MPMDTRAVTTDLAPAALGPYSQAVVAGGLVFCSGTAGIDPVTGEIADGIEAQTEQALRNLAAILDEAGSSLRDVVKTTIFYTNVDDFPVLNAVYARHMPDPPPARSAPANVRLPRGLLVSDLDEAPHRTETRLSVSCPRGRVFRQDPSVPSPVVSIRKPLMATVLF